MIIEGSEAHFDIAETDPLTYETYIGSFRVKCFLNPLETIRADRLYRELIGPVNPILASESAKNFAFAVAQLSVRVIKSPKFFYNETNPDLNGGHLPDNVLIAILNKSIDAESKFRDDRKKKYKKTQKDLTKKFKEKQIQKKVEDEEEEKAPANPGEEQEIDIDDK